MHSCDKKKTTPSDTRENDSAANRNTNATALRIVIDSPSYIPQKFPRLDSNQNLQWKSSYSMFGYVDIN